MEFVLLGMALVVVVGVVHVVVGFFVSKEEGP